MQNPAHLQRRLHCLPRKAVGSRWLPAKAIAVRTRSRKPATTRRGASAAAAPAAAATAERAALAATPAATRAEPAGRSAAWRTEPASAPATAPTSAWGIAAATPALRRRWLAPGLTRSLPLLELWLILLWLLLLLLLLLMLKTLLLLLLRRERAEASALLTGVPGRARTLRRRPAAPMATRRRAAALETLRALLLKQLGSSELHELLLLRLLCQDDAAPS